MGNSMVMAKRLQYWWSILVLLGFLQTQQIFAKECPDLRDNETVISVTLNNTIISPSRVNKSWYEVTFANDLNLTVTCVSKSPVLMKFHGLLTNPALKTEIFRTTQSNGDVCHRVQAIFKPDRFATGKYSCTHSPNATFKEDNSTSSVFIFANGQAFPHLLIGGGGRQRHPLKILMSEKGRPALLPCVTTNYSIPIKLFKIQKENGKRIDLTESDGVTYSPTEGFTATNVSCGDEFMCSEDSSIRGSTRLEVSCPTEPQIGKIQFKVNRTSENDRKYICINADFMSAVECNSRQECEFVRSCGNQMEQLKCLKSWDCPDFYQNHNNCLSIHDDRGEFRGLIFCSNGEDSIVREVFSDVRGKPAFNIDFSSGYSKPSRDYDNRKWIDSFYTDVKHWKGNVNFTQYERAKFQCNVSKTLGTGDIEWIFETLNSTRVPATTVGVPSLRSDVDQNIYSLTSEISFNSTNIKKLICRSPKLNSSDWLEAELQTDITVTDYSRLQLVNPTNKSVETRNVPISKDGEIQELSCETIGTNVIIKWEVDGVPAQSHHTIHEIILPNHRIISYISIYHDQTRYKADKSRTNYTCTATDVLGNQVSKTFQVFWYAQFPYILVLSIVVAVALACLLIFVVLVKIMKDKWKDKAIRKIVKEFYNGKRKLPEDLKFAPIPIGKYENYPVTDPPPRIEVSDFWFQKFNKKYEITNPQQTLRFAERLSSGNFGDVYKGTLEKNGIEYEVAIKKLQNFTEAKHLRDFLNEILLLQVIGDHQNVIRFHGAVTEDMLKHRDPKIVLELCLGDLKSYFCKLYKDSKEDPNVYFEDEINPPMTNGYYTTQMVTASSTNQQTTYLQTLPKIRTRHLFKWCSQIACGMEHISACGIVHRDLAARNILLTQNFNVKIGDFGLSKELQKEKTYYISNSQFQDFIPARWVAPEVFEEGKFSTDSDVWSFGITMWEIFNLGLYQPYQEYPEDAHLLTNLRDHFDRGQRLNKPKYANDAIFDTILECWESNRFARPRFSNLRKLISDAQASLNLSDINDDQIASDAESSDGTRSISSGDEDGFEPSKSVIVPMPNDNDN